MALAHSRSRSPVLLSLLAGALYGLAQPGFGLWPLAFVCLAPWYLALRGAALGRRLALGWLAGSAAVAVGCLAQGALGAARYFGVGAFAAWGGAFLVGQVWGVGAFLLAAALTGRGEAGALPSALHAGLAFAAGEWARGHLAGGLPWLPFAAAITPVPGLAQAAALGGALLVSAALAAANSALASNPRTALGLLALGFALPAVRLVWVPPGVHLASPVPARAELRVVLVHGAAPARHALATSDASAALASLAASTPNDGDGGGLAVWPENSVPWILPANVGRVLAAFGEHGKPPSLLLAGATRSVDAAAPAFFSSALLIDRDGRVVASHDKHRLVPFAERMPGPLRGTGMELTPGSPPRPIELADGRRVGVQLCFEILFSELARNLSRSGAQAILHLSNEAWFAGTGASEQLHAAAILRAIETGRPVLRSTNGGITAALDATGRELTRHRGDKRGALRVDLAGDSAATPYVCIGDAWLALVGAAAAARSPRGRDRAGTGRGDPADGRVSRRSRAPMIATTALPDGSSYFCAASGAQSDIP